MRYTGPRGFEIIIQISVPRSPFLHSPPSFYSGFVFIVFHGWDDGALGMEITDLDPWVVLFVAWVSYGVFFVLASGTEWVGIYSGIK
jgi:hypothetical protein